MPPYGKKTRYAGGGYSYTKGPIRKPRAKRKPVKKRMDIKKVVNKILRSKIETKQSTSTITDGVEIFHNNFVTLDAANTFLAVNYGLLDPMDAVGNRVGDEITVKGISIKMMVELNERYSDVTFRFMIVKGAKFDTPTRASLYAGKSGNKMLDNINNERYTIIAQKYFKLKAPNMGTTGSAETVDMVPAGWNAANPKLSRATKIVRLYIPGSKFGPGGLIRYENNSATQQKFFDYTCVLYAYSNFTTSQDVFYVARVNDYVKTIYYTDS